MADEAIQVVHVQDDFYRDSFGKVIVIMTSLFIAIACLVALSIYLYINAPPPIAFGVDKEWRVQPDVPVDKPYLTTAEVTQWLSDVFPRSFNLDFLNYTNQLKDISGFFTPNGFKVFQSQLNNYANQTYLQSNKLFVNGTAAGAPFLCNELLTDGRYLWWLQMPITLTYNTSTRSSSQILVFQVWVVRIPTLNNLFGVAIDNVIVAKSGTICER